MPCLFGRSARRVQLRTPCIGELCQGADQCFKHARQGAKIAVWFDELLTQIQRAIDLNLDGVALRQWPPIVLGDKPSGIGPIGLHAVSERGQRTLNGLCNFTRARRAKTITDDKMRPLGCRVAQGRRWHGMAIDQENLTKLLPGLREKLGEGVMEWRVQPLNAHEGNGDGDLTEVDILAIGHQARNYAKTTGYSGGLRV